MNLGFWILIGLGILMIISKIKKGNYSPEFKRTNWKRCGRDFFNYVIAGLVGGYIALWLNECLKRNQSWSNASLDIWFINIILILIIAFLLYHSINYKKYLKR